VCIEENLKKIKEQIGNNNVKIIAVTKYATDEQVIKAYSLGVQNFGESYVQSALKRIKELFPSEKTINWHLIGRLQKNKVKHVINNFHLIHSVDSYELAEAINNCAIKKNSIQKLLLQVNIVQDPTKAGFSIDSLLKQFEEINNLSNIEVIGLSTIAPHTSDENLLKSCFMGLANFKDEINDKFQCNLNELSMGMSNDYKVAIQCKATMIRIGRAIFSNKSGG